MANKKKPAKSKGAVAVPVSPSSRNQVAEYILSFQDKKYTENHINNLMKIYESTEQAEFVQQFLAVFQVTICEDLKNKRADNVLAFYLAFMMACEGDETHQLWEEFFNWILNHKNTQTHVRIRMCQFIEQFLGAMNMNAVLDANICEGIERYMILNADDFSNLVRSVALNGLQRLQDPSNPTAATWKHYLFHLNDPAPNVRKAVISSICKNRFSISKLLEHLMDKVDSVRAHLVQSLANVSYKHYKTEDRIKLIEDGLQASQHASVRTGIQDTILVSWFAEMDRNYVKFTKNLLLESSWKEFQRSTAAAKRALKHLFSVDAAYLQYLEHQLTKTEHELMDSICESVERSLVLESSNSGSATATADTSRVTATFEQCLDMNRLTPEVAIYWSAVLEYYQERHEDDAIFPELNLYLRYLEVYGRRSAKAAGDLKQKRRFQYVFGLLVDNLHMYDFKDECCRTFLKETSGRLILSPSIKKDTLKTLLRIHGDVYPEEAHYLDAIVRAIHEDLSGEANRVNGVAAEQAIDTSSSRGAEQEVRIKHHLKVVYLLMVGRRIRRLTPLLKELFVTVIFPRIENGDRKIRIWSTKCTATYAALDPSMAQTFYYKLIAQLQVQHNVPVWAVIIESIFDLLARYGIEFLSGGPEKDGGGGGEREGSTTAAAAANRNGRALYSTTSECWGGAQLDESMEQVNILEVLQTLYDDCSDLLIVRPIVLGFCRLILTEQCQSVELMMKLLVTFFTSDTYPELVQILGAFFVELCENQLQDLLVMSLLPTLEYVAANPSLPVDMDSVVQFVVDSTSPKSSESGQYHLKLAHLFVETIQTNDKHKTLVKIMFKYLNQLEIPFEAIDRSELERMCTSLAKCEHVKPDQLETVRRKLSGVRKEGSEGVLASTTQSMTVVVAEEEEEEKEKSKEADSQDVEMAEELDVTVSRVAVSSSNAHGTVDDDESEENTTIPATPDQSKEEEEEEVTATNTVVEQTTAEEEQSTVATALTVGQAEEVTQQGVEEEEGEETDCSLSSFKENHTTAREENISSSLRRGQRGRPVRSTAIPRRIGTAPQTAVVVTKKAEEEERKLRPATKNASKIPIMAVGGQGRNKRSLDRSTTQMTPGVKQKRTDADPNVRKRGWPPLTKPATNGGAPNTPTRTVAKNTSTPMSEKMRASRVVLSPLDMSEINKTRPKTRSASVSSQRALRTRNTNK